MADGKIHWHGSFSATLRIEFEENFWLRSLRNNLVSGGYGCDCPSELERSGRGEENV